MTMSTVDAIEAMAAEQGAEVTHVSNGAVSAIVASEVSAQLDAAHRYPRSITRFLNEAMSMATISREVAESCIYSLPRGGKIITGPSVRLAEICASAYGNLQIAARVVDTEEREVVAQGAAWDMQKNLRATIEVRRRITKKNGSRYDDDMIVVTGNAAASIALRNAIFRAIPRAYVDSIYAKARTLAVGDAKSLATRRDELMARLEKLGVPKERVLSRIGKSGMEDVGLDDIEVLIGLGTAIKNGDQSIDQAFPEPAPAPAAPENDGRRMSIGKGKGKGKDTPEREPGEEG